MSNSEPEINGFNKSVYNKISEEKDILEDQPESDTVTAQNVASKKTFKERYFGKMNEGSIRGCIFSLIIMTIGSSALALPQRFAKMTLLVGVIDVILAGSAALWTFNLLIIVGIKYNTFDYSKLVEKLYGRALGLVLDITIIIYVFGVITLYQVILYKLVGGLVMDIGGWSGDYKDMDDFSKRSFWNNTGCKFPIQFGILIFVLLPLCLLRNIGKLRFTSILGVISLFVMYFVVYIESPWYMKDYWTNLYDANDPKTHINFYNVGIGFGENLSFLKGTATLFYGFGTHYGAYPLMKVLANPTYTRLQKVFFRGLTICIILYMSMGVIGYLSVPINTPDLIIERYSLLQPDIFMSIGRGLFIFTLMFKIPANYNSLRSSLLTLIFGTTDVATWKNYAVTLPTLFIACLISVLYKEIIDYISLMGSFCAIVVSFICPCLMYLKTNDYPRYHWKNVVTFTLMMILSAIGVMSGIFTILDMISKSDS